MGYKFILSSKDTVRHGHTHIYLHALGTQTHLKMNKIMSHKTNNEELPIKVEDKLIKTLLGTEIASCTKQNLFTKYHITY